MISGSEQFIHIPKIERGFGASKDVLKTINSLFDLQDHPELVIISGNLSTQLVNEYMPDHTVITITERDIEKGWTAVFETGICNCRATFLPDPSSCEDLPAENLPSGLCPNEELPFPPFVRSTLVQPDVIINPIPDLNRGIRLERQNKLRVVRMNVTAGTPLWVGIKDAK
jgi:hypothetical protein